MSRRPLVLVLGAVIAVTAAATSVTHAANPSEVASSISAGPVESTALYCTGLGASGSPAGHVVVLNTADHTREVAVEIDTDIGTTQTRHLVLAAHRSTSVSPPPSGHWYGITLIANGRGVVADELNAPGTAQAPCLNAGSTIWYASGLDTTVGSRAYVTLYNPSSTSAVVNVTAETASGFSAPAPYQGVAIPAHRVVTLDLGTRIVNQANVGIRVRAIRGEVVSTAVQQAGTVTSFNAGSSELARTDWFPRVTTVSGSLARILITNPSDATASVKATIGLAPYTVAPQSVTVAPYSTGSIVITPNSAVPAHGYATVRLYSSVPVAASLATGTASGESLSVPAVASTLYLVSDFAGRGFDAMTATNVGDRPLSVTVTVLGAIATSRVITVAPGATIDLRGRDGVPSTLRGRSFLIGANRRDLIVATTLPTTPRGIAVVSALNGG